MKRNWLTIFLAMLLVGASLVEGTVISSTQDGVDLDISLISQDPDPVNPGEYVELRWKVINTGTQNAENVVFELIPEYPFSLDPGVSAQKELINVWGLQEDEEGVILYYKVRVDKDAVEGDTGIKLKYQITDAGGSYWHEPEEFTVRVQTVDAALVISSVETIPESIVPGEESKVKVELTNLADSVMEDITLKLDLSSDDTPIAPIGSATEKRVRYLSPGQVTEVEFDVMALANADSQVYKVPIELTYYDELETKYEKEDLIGVVVGAMPNLMVQVDESNIVKKRSTGDVTIRVVNKGLSDVKFFNIKLNPNVDYNVLSPSEVYIGDIDSDDYETADFKLYVKGSIDGKVKLPFVVEYLDANNNKYTEKYDLHLDLKNTAKINGNGSKLPLLIVILLLAGAGYWYYRRSHKKKRR